MSSPVRAGLLGSRIAVQPQEGVGLLRWGGLSLKGKAQIGNGGVFPTSRILAPDYPQIIRFMGEESPGPGLLPRVGRLQVGPEVKIAKPSVDGGGGVPPVCPSGARTPRAAGCSGNWTPIFPSRRLLRASHPHVLGHPLCVSAPGAEEAPWGVTGGFQPDPLVPPSPSPRARGVGPSGQSLRSFIRVLGCKPLGNHKGLAVAGKNKCPPQRRAPHHQPDILLRRAGVLPRDAAACSQN